MQLTYLITLLVVAIVVGTGVLSYLGWADWIVRGSSVRKGWRSSMTLVALVSLSLTAMLFVGYSIHNVLIGGDQGGNANTLLCIRSGTYLAVASILASLGGQGRGRWAALAGGCLTLFLWFWQGISL